MHENAFLHWHLHYEASKFDGMISPKEAEDDLVKYDKPCLAITDHGTMGMALAVHDVCKKHGKKFVPGSEMYVCNDIFRKLDSPKRDKFDKKRHVVVLAMNQVGMDNLTALSSLASMYFNAKPRVDHDAIFERSEGLVITTACMGGIVAAPLLWDEKPEGIRRKNAYEIACRYREVLRDNFYLEIQPVRKVEQLYLNEFLIELHRKEGFQLIATNDAHYAYEDQYEHHARLISIQNKNNDTDLIYKPGHHLRNKSEMIDAFRANGTTAIGAREVDLAIETANALHEKFEGVKIERHLKIPEYREITDE